jgi:hypothetical protein
MLTPTILTLSVALATTSTFRIDPDVRDPACIWHIDAETPGADLREAMFARGLSPERSGVESRASRGARDIVLTASLERVNEAYLRSPDGRGIPGRSVGVTFVALPPDPRRFPRGPGRDYARLCIDGASRRCGGTLGAQYLDPGNRRAEDDCDPGRIGVFAGRICGERSRLEPRLRAGESRFVDGTYRLGDGTAADDDRFVAARLALEDWGTAIGNVAAHEIGHAMGLEHDRRSGHVMEARISTEDLSDGALAFSPASLRVLASNAGIARGASTERARCVLRSERETTLGALARSAVQVLERDEANRVTERFGAAERALPEGRPARPEEPGEGIVFRLRDDDPVLVPTSGAAERRELLARVARLRERADAIALAEGLASAVPRIAGDAAIDLLALLEDTKGGAAAGRDLGLRARVVEALERNLAAFEDPRPLLRIVGRVGASEAAEAVIDAIASSGDADLSRAGAEAVAALGARDALARRAFVTSAGEERRRLQRAYARMPPTSIGDLEAILEGDDEPAARHAARMLLGAGPIERARLFEAAKRLPPARRAWVEGLRARPRGG